MTKDKRNTSSYVALRQKAKEHLRKKKTEKTLPIAEAETGNLRHELAILKLVCKMQDKELQQSREKTELILNSSRLKNAMYTGNIAWWEMDCKSGAVVFQENKALILGYKPEQFSHYSDFTKLLHPEDFEPAMKAMRDHLSGKLPHYDVEYRIKTAGGDYRWFHDLGGISEADGANKSKKVTGIVIDVTSRKIAEELLDKSRKEFQSYFDSNSIGMSVTSYDGTWIAVNQRLCQLFGYTKKELTGISWFELSHPDDLASNLKLFQQALDGKIDHYEIDKQFICKDGSIVFVTVSAVCQRNEDGSAHHFLTSYFDNTARIKAELALRQSETRLKEAQTLARIGNFHYDVQSDQVWWSEELCRLYGLEPANKPLSLAEVNSFLHPDDKRIVDEMFQRVPEIREPIETEYRIVRADGSVRYHHAITHSTPDERNKTLMIDGTIQDITERKLVENALQVEESRMRAITQSAQDAILMMNPDGNISFLNPATERMFGYAYDELAGKNLHFLLAPQRYHVSQHKAFASFLKTGKGGALGKNLELKALRKDGQEISIELSLSSLKFPDGWYAVGIIRDITARKKAEEALKESRQLFQNLAHVSPVGIFRTRTDGYTTYVNPRWSELSGLSFEEALGNGWLKAVHPDDRDRLSTNWNADVYTQQQSNAEYRFLKPDGSIVWVIGNAVPEIIDNSISGFIGTITDITERKHAEEEIRKLNEGLEQRVLDRTAQFEAANRELEAFSYSVSHDLRSPLRALDGFANILLEDYSHLLDTEGKRLLHIIAANANKMGDLIDDLLAFSRVNRHEMTVRKIDMYAMANSVYQELTKDALINKIEFLVNNIPEASGDTAMMRQVWLNLIGNAIKFSSKKPECTIEIGNKIEAGEIIYYVKDSGAGFDMEYSNKLFGVFKRLHSTKEFEGTGIGLSIVQRIIHRHGGRVWAEGKVNKGATFYFALPVKS